MVGLSYFRIAVSSALLTVATLIAVFNLSPVGFAWVPAILGFLAAGFAMFIRNFKSYLTVRAIAQESVEFSSSLVPSFSLGGTTIQVMMSSLRSGFGRVLGTGFLLGTKIVSFLVLGLASLLAVFYLIFAHFDHGDPTVFLGTWLVLVGFLLLFLERLPLAGALIGRPVYYSLALDLASWLMDAVSLSLFLLALGSLVWPHVIFLPLAILLLLERTSPTFYGLGQNELLGELALSVFVPVFPAFMSVLLWDISRLFSALILTESWRNLEKRQVMAQYI